MTLEIGQVEIYLPLDMGADRVSQIEPLRLQLDIHIGTPDENDISIDFGEASSSRTIREVAKVFSNLL